MPRGQKSKLRARQKRRQAQDEPQDAQATGAEKGEYASCSSPDSGDAVPSTSVAGLPQKPQGAPPTTTAAAGGSCKKSGKGGRSQGAEGGHFSKAPRSAESRLKDLIMRKSEMVMQYLLLKYKMKQPILKGEMLKMVSKRFREYFPEILRKASNRVELVFGLELQEAKPKGNSYTFVSKLELSNSGSLTSELGFPRTGLLIPLLAVIFLNGNCATEEEVWGFLNMLGVYDGSSHIIFGDTRKLITQDLVREKYLVYRQVRGSDPPRHEFLWGPRACAETSKMKVLEFLAKVNDNVPSDFPSHYEEALRDEEERAQTGVAGRGGTPAKASPSPKVKSRHYTP